MIGCEEIWIVNSIKATNDGSRSSRTPTPSVMTAPIKTPAIIDARIAYSAEVVPHSLWRGFDNSLCILRYFNHLIS